MNFNEQQSYLYFPSLCTLDSAIFAGIVLGSIAAIVAVTAISRWCYFSPKAPTGEDDIVSTLPPQEVQRATEEDDMVGIPSQCTLRDIPRPQRASPAPIPAKSEHRAISRFYAENHAENH